MYKSHNKGIPSWTMWNTEILYLLSFLLIKMLSLTLVYVLRWHRKALWDEVFLDILRGFLGAHTVIKNLPAKAIDIGDEGSVLVRRWPGVRNDYSLQHFCLETSRHRRVWWATVHGPKSRTQLSLHTLPLISYLLCLDLDMSMLLHPSGRLFHPHANWPQ